MLGKMYIVERKLPTQNDQVTLGRRHRHADPVWRRQPLYSHLHPLAGGQEESQRQSGGRTEGSAQPDW